MMQPEGGTPRPFSVNVIPFNDTSSLDSQRVIAYQAASLEVNRIENFFNLAALLVLLGLKKDCFAYFLSWSPRTIDQKATLGDAQINLINQIQWYRSISRQD